MRQACGGIGDGSFIVVHPHRAPQPKSPGPIVYVRLLRTPRTSCDWGAPSSDDEGFRCLALTGSAGVFALFCARTLRTRRNRNDIRHRAERNRTRRNRIGCLPPMIASVRRCAGIYMRCVRVCVRNNSYVREMGAFPSSECVTLLSACACVGWD